MHKNVGNHIPYYIRKTYVSFKTSVVSIFHEDCKEPDDLALNKMPFKVKQIVKYTIFQFEML